MNFDSNDEPQIINTENSNLIAKKQHRDLKDFIVKRHPKSNYPLPHKYMTNLNQSFKSFDLKPSWRDAQNVYQDSPKMKANLPCSLDISRGTSLKTETDEKRNTFSLSLPNVNKK